MQLDLFISVELGPPSFVLYIQGKHTDDRTHYLCSVCGQRIYDGKLGSHFDRVTLKHV